MPIFRDNITHVLRFPYITVNLWGMSLFITSPYFLYLFLLQYKDKISKALLITTFIIAIPIILYYGIGFEQFGYRYSLDFLPILFFLLIKNYKFSNSNLTDGFRSLILLSACFNLYLFITH